MAAPMCDVKTAAKEGVATTTTTTTTLQPAKGLSLTEWITAAKVSKQCISLGIESNVDVLTAMHKEYEKLAETTAAINSEREVVVVDNGRVMRAHPAIQLVGDHVVRVMTVNLLALVNCTPVFYPGCNMKPLWDVRRRLATIVGWIAAFTPHAIAFQEADLPTIEYLSAVLAGSYVAGEFAPDVGLPGRVMPVGCVVFVHRLVPCKFGVGVLDGRGLSRADIQLPGWSTRVVSYKIGFKGESGMEQVENVVKQLWETEFKGQASGFLGTDSNMPAATFLATLLKCAPAFAPSLNLADYQSPTFLHCQDLKKCGAIDAVVHFGAPANAACRSFPVFTLNTPNEAADLPKACETYQLAAGSDHVPLVAQITTAPKPNAPPTETAAAAAATPAAAQ